MGYFEINGEKLSYRANGELLEIIPYGKNIFRVRGTENPNIADIDWTLLPAEKTNISWQETEVGYSAQNGKITFEIFQNGQFRCLKAGKEIFASQTFKNIHTNITRSYKSVGGNHFKIRSVFKAFANEHFYGLGHEFTDVWDLKNASFDLCHRNTKCTIPFVYSSNGYGFLWNSPAIGRVEFSKNRTLWEAEEAKQMDFLIIGGDSPAEVMEGYAKITGFAPKMPDWATGFWQCKLRYLTQDEVLSVAREYKARGIQLSTIIIDYFHWTEQGEFQFDPKYWPDPKAMVKELREMGIEPIVSVWPTVHENTKYFKELNDKNLLVRTEKGSFDVFNFHGPVTYYDMTNPKAREFAWNLIKQNYYELGIKTFWLDVAEPEIYHREDYDNVRYSLGNGNQCYMIYPYYYQKMFVDGLKAEGIEDICLLSRCGWVGSQRQHALIWSGDIPSKFESLKISVQEGLNMAMSGIPWWNSDIGGFGGGDGESDYFKELIVRWFQFGVFCPVMRLHGARKFYGEQDPELLEPTCGPNEIWVWGARNYEILKDLIALRERLRPYVAQQMDFASKTGTPVMRPMFYDFNEEICYSLGDQYMFGPDILFAPIVNEGQTERQVYLPGGEEWVNVRTGETVTGGKFVTCKAEIHEFIAFVKKGAKVLEVF